MTALCPNGHGIAAPVGGTAFCLTCAQDADDGIDPELARRRALAPEVAEDDAGGVDDGEVSGCVRWPVPMAWGAVRFAGRWRCNGASGARE